MEQRIKLEVLSKRKTYVQSVMLACGVNKIILTSQQILNYLLDVSDVPGYIVFSGEEATFYSDSRFAIELQQIPLSLCQPVVYVGNIWEYLTAQRKITKEKTGAECWKMTAEQYISLQKHTGKQNIVDISGGIRQLLNFHDSLSMEKLQKALRITREAFTEISQKIVPGCTEKAIAAELSYLLKTKEAISEAFPLIVAFGENSAKPHAQPSGRKLRKQDVVLIDFGCYFQGVYTDVTRTRLFGSKKNTLFTESAAAIGEVTDEVRKILKPGVTTRELDTTAREILSRKSYNKLTLDAYFSHALGHGIGYEIHAVPVISRRTEVALIPGNIVTIEPGVYFQGKFGYRHEDMYLITENTAKKLTDIHV